MVPFRSAKVLSTLSLALGALVLGLAACSPYVYREEIASFGSGVDTSVAAFTAMTPAYAAWATEQRDGELLAFARNGDKPLTERSEEHTSELQSLMRISYAVFCLKKKTKQYYIMYEGTDTML